MAADTSVRFETWFWEPHLDWPETLRNRNRFAPESSGQRFAPLFLQMKSEWVVRFDTGLRSRAEVFFAPFQTTMPREVKGDKRALVAAEVLSRIPLQVEPFEAGLISARRPVEAFVYIPVAELRSVSVREAIEYFFHILDVGESVCLSRKSSPFFPQTVLCQGDKPVVAVIDTDIGFLNSSFTTYDPMTKSHRTRFMALWVQSREKVATTANFAQLGRVLSHRDIQGMLDRGAGLDEFEEYRQLNGELLDADVHRGTEHGFSQGTHVLDLAGGANPYEPPRSDDLTVREWPLLGVQLPPAGHAEASGARLETRIVLGVRWILWAAATFSETPPPVIINISLSGLSGSRDGTRFLEQQIARELEHYPGAEVVYAHETEQLRRQVARLSNVSSETRHIAWNVQPDDFSANYVEIRADGSDQLPTQLEIGLTDPTGRSIPLSSIHEGGILDLGDHVRIYHVPRRVTDPLATPPLHSAAKYVVAIAPTASKEAGAVVSDAGTWTLSLRNTAPSPVTLSLHICGDDGALDGDARYRASYFDDPAAYAFDCGPPAPRASQTINLGERRSGQSHAAASSVPAEVRSRIRSVGSEDCPPVVARSFMRRGFGDEFQVPQETASGDLGVTTSMLASGTFSGSVRVLDGARAAAPQIARYRAHLAAAKADTGLFNPVADGHDLVPDRRVAEFGRRQMR